MNLLLEEIRQIVAEQHALVGGPDGVCGQHVVAKLRKAGFADGITVIGPEDADFVPEGQCMIRVRTELGGEGVHFLRDYPFPCALCQGAFEDDQVDAMAETNGDIEKPVWRVGAAAPA